MEIEYIGRLLQDGHLSMDPSILPKLKKGEILFENDPEPIQASVGDG